MPLLAQVSSKGQGAESKTTHTLAGVLSRKIQRFNGKHGVMPRAAALKRPYLTGVKSRAAICGAVTETATKSNALAHYLISGTIPGNRSVLKWASTDPELTGENAGRCGAGNIFGRVRLPFRTNRIIGSNMRLGIEMPMENFPRSFAGRDDASEKDCRMVIGLENRQAQEGITTFGIASGDSCGGDKSY